MEKTQALKKMLGLKLQDVRGYYEKMLTAKEEHFKAFNESEELNKKGNKRALRVQEGVAIIPIRGVISQYFDFWTWFFGGCASEDLDAQIDAALSDTSIKGIILDIDSPGGEIGGVNDLANKIFAAREQKTIVSYVSDQAASAGYWLGSAASQVIAGEVALIGSIGLVASFGNEEEKTIDFFSSVSPKKGAKATETEGAEQIQQWVNDIGAVFVERVASFRGVSTEHVINNFGQGDVMIASNALAAGMVDRVGNFKAALALASGQALEEPIAQSGEAPVLSAKNNIGKINSMKNTIFARIKNGLKAELVIVDTDNADAVIPDDAIALTEIDVPWLEQNLPELVEEIKQLGREEENGRQEEIEEMDPEAPEEAPAEEAPAQAILRQARRDTSVKPSDVALKLMKSFKGTVKKEAAPTKAETVDPIPSSNGKDAQTQADKDKAELRAGAEKAAAAKLAARKNKAGVLS